MGERLKVYSDSQCRVPVESFSFGELRKNVPYRISFYMRNEGFIRIEEILLEVHSSNSKVSARMISESKLKHLRPHEVHRGMFELYASEKVKKADVELAVNGVICYLR